MFLLFFIYFCISNLYIDQFSTPCRVNYMAKSSLKNTFNLILLDGHFKLYLIQVAKLHSYLNIMIKGSSLEFSIKDFSSLYSHPTLLKVCHYESVMLKSLGSKSLM